MTMDRYDVGILQDGMEPDENGGWVIWEDVEELLAKYDRLREALSALTAAARKEAAYDEVLRRHLWLYLERAEKVLQEAEE